MADIAGTPLKSLDTVSDMSQNSIATLNAIGVGIFIEEFTG